MSEIYGDEIFGEDDLFEGDDDEFAGDGRRVPASALPVSFAGLEAVTIAAAGTEDVQCNIARNLRPDRFVLKSTQAPDLDVMDIKVGTVSLNVSKDPVPGDCFLNTAVGTRLKCVETATPSVGITVRLRNNSAGNLTPKGGFFGPSTKARG